MSIPEDRFEFHVRACYPAAYARVVRIVGTRELAEDVLQEALVKAWQARGQLREEARFGGWFLQIATREAVAASRARRVRQGRDVDAEGLELADAAPDPAQAAQLRDEATRAWRALDRLSSRQRVVFVMCAVESMRLREAAACLGITTGAAKRHLRRARDRLRRFVIDDEMEI